MARNDETTNPYQSPAPRTPSPATYDAAGLRTSPVDTDEYPPAFAYIIGNECAERFSFYGMNTLLVVFMTQQLVQTYAMAEVTAAAAAKEYYHYFKAAAYFFPIFGSILADGLIGKYRTIFWLSLVYCVGHLVLALELGWNSFVLGLTLIALGSGGIKPCVSANLGDQFGPRNQHLIESAYGWFYFSINVGSFISTLLTPWLAEVAGYSVAFGVPGVLMAIATVIFWAGRREYTHIPPAGKKFFETVFQPSTARIAGRLALIYVPVTIFWSIYDQHGSAWVQQAEQMDRNLWLFTPAANQVQAVNPLLIITLVPLFNLAIYPFLGRFIALTAVRKVVVGLILTGAAFAITGMAQAWMDGGATVHISWQLLAFVVLTVAEILVSVATLEFAYTQAPNKLKSVVMAVHLFAVAAGNLLTSQVNRLIKEKYLVLDGANYYWFFTVAVLGAAVFAGIVMLFFKEERHIQGATEPTGD